MDTQKRGQAPYGFRWQDGDLLQVPEEAETRRSAAAIFLKLKSMGAVARELNGKKLFTRRGGKWSDVQVARILECPSAIGRYEIARSPKAGEQQGSTGRKELIECEPIVSRQVWEQVTELIGKQRSQREAAPKQPAPLSGLVACGCGARMGLTDGKFTCRPCNATIRADELESVFATDFAELLSGHPVLAAALELPSERRHWMEQIAGIDATLADALRQREAVERRFSESSISKARFEELHAPLDKKVRQLERELSDLRRAVSSDKAVTPKPASKDWPAIWSSWPARRRREITTTFLDGIVVNGGEIEISYLLPDPSGSKETPELQQITCPTNQSRPGDPVYVRLPKPGEKCSITGLSRAKLNELILPNERNNFTPPVASKSLRQKGAQRGIRLVLLESLMNYLSGNRT